MHVVVCASNENESVVLLAGGDAGVNYASAVENVQRCKWSSVGVCGDRGVVWCVGGLVALGCGT